MKKRYIYTLILLLTGCTYLKSQNEQYDLVIRDVTIFNSISKVTETNKTICIVNDTIAKIISSEIKVQGKKILDGNGKLIIPGFIDTHMHLSQLFGDGNEIAIEEISDSKLYKQAFWI